MPLGAMLPRPRIARSAPGCLVVLVAALAVACGDGGSAPPASVDVAAVRQDVRLIVDPTRPTRATTAGFAPPWYFVGIPGAGHSDLIEAVGEPYPPLEVSRQALVAFFDEHLGGTAGATSAALATLAAAGNGVDLAE